MAENPSPKWKLKACESSPETQPGPAAPGAEDRMPTKAELLHELRLHGAKPLPPHEIPAMSRRTRDYLLLVGIGSSLICFAIFKVMPDSERATVGRLALTAVGAYAGLLWYIFYAVMGRY